MTGGGGFVGRAVVEALLAEGHAVTSASRRAHPELEELGACTVRMDLGDPDSVEAAVRGHDTVFHVAAKTGVWGPRSEYRRTNVDGTRHVLDAARRHGVQRLVFTSSPSVCFDGHDHRCAGNDVPYASEFLCAYPETKAEAERLVLAANKENGLATCALRPHLVIGPRDPHLVPRLIERASKKRLAIVGGGHNEVSLTWIGNAAQAHVDAARTLAPDAPHAGKAYFIAQEQPVELWPWINELLAAVGVDPVTRRVPRRVAYGVGALMELTWRMLRLAGEPPMTRFVALQLATTHSYDPEPARRDFGYRERVGMEEATRRLVADLRTRG
ncbi:MAG: NAD-dependent epimerase/dehydratase family protein [Planctomycetota bacterium]|nr:NAD-dependent epimerase/dehydratase family protein [Planctomycetota bacterium]